MSFFPKLVFDIRIEEKWKDHIVPYIYMHTKIQDREMFFSYNIPTFIYSIIKWIESSTHDYIMWFFINPV